MADKNIQIGRAQAHYSARGDRILKYSLEIYHSDLKEHKLITAPELHMVETKAELQIAKWEAQWRQIEEKRERREKKVADAQEAERQTAEAKERLEELEGVLKFTLNINDAIDWESLKVKAHFSVQKPQQPEAPEPKKYGPNPNLTWPEFSPNYTLFEKLFKGLKGRKDESVRAKFQAATIAWGKEKSNTDAFNESETLKHQAELIKWNDACSNWEKCKIDFYQKQERFNSEIDQLRENYQKHEQNAVEQYCEMVLNNSKYPEIISKDFELLYNSESKILICEYYLPDPDKMPRLREVKYIASRGELKQSSIAESQAEKMYDALIYQIVLRTIHELFEADTAHALDAISLNGRVRFISKATGKVEEACIVSLQVKKDQFLEIDLNNVDPQDLLQDAEWHRELKAAWHHGSEACSVDRQE